MIWGDAAPLSPADEATLFRNIFRQAGTAMLLIDFDTGRIVGANPAAARFYGYPTEELCGMPISRINILPPEIVRQRMEEARSRQRGYFVFRHRLASGEIRDVAVYSGPVVVRAKTFLYSVIHDITEEVRLRRERESLAKRLRLAMDVGKVVAWELHEDGQMYVTWPQKGRYPLAQQGNPLPLETVVGWFVPEHQSVWTTALQACLLHGHPLSVELRDGQGRWVQVEGLRLEDGDGIRVVGVFHDITPVKMQAEAECQRRKDAEAAARAKDEFLRFLSHELRTPLSGLVGLLRILCEGRGGNRDALLLQARERAESLLRLLSDALDLCRLDVGQMPLVDEDFSPQALCASQVSLFAPQAEAKGVELRLVCDLPASRLVAAPKARLEQVLSNLLSNAVKFTDHGEIVVTCVLHGTEDGEALAFTVQDTGCGIPPELQARLFEPYAQGVLETKLARGSGLGLSIVQALVQRMGGTITVESEEGTGTTFRVTVPVRPVAQVESDLQESPQARFEETSCVGSDSWDVLVAEDDPVNQMVARTLLERLGHRVEVVSNGAEAVAAVARRRFHVVLLDVAMPQMDGLEAARRIRQMHPSLPLVAVSAFTSADDQQRFAAVMDFVLTKPLSLDALVQVCAQVAARSVA
ncbi:MAG: ATP-binding protein [Desulfomicrobiaceae bacterium]